MKKALNQFIFLSSLFGSGYLAAYSVCDLNVVDCSYETEHFYFLGCGIGTGLTHSRGWGNANNDCIARFGTELATVDSDAKQQEIYNVTPVRDKYAAWIGIHSEYINNQWGWYWADGSEVQWFNWKTGVLHTAVNNRCVMNYNPEYPPHPDWLDWYPWDCNQNTGYAICNKPTSGSYFFQFFLTNFC